MADNKPAPQNGKAYVAPLVIAVVIVALSGVFFLWEVPAPPPVVAKNPPAVTVAERSTPTPAMAAATTPPVLMRKDLLDAARAGAAAFAEHNRQGSASAALIGRRFSLRIPFGCAGVQNALEQTSVSIGALRKSITLSARPGIWTGLPLFQSQSGEVREAIEGFWIPRPWTNIETCPPQSAHAAPATSTPVSAPVFGLAQIFTAADSRLGRHADKPYEFTRKLPADKTLWDHSYHLLLEGIVAGYDDGLALRCWMETPHHHPICVFAVKLDRVGFEDGTTGEILASWND